MFGSDDEEYIPDYEIDDGEELATTKVYNL